MRQRVLVIVTVTAATLAGSAQQVSTIDRLVSAMTLDEKIAMLHGATDPQSLGQAGYVPGVPHLGIPPLRLTDGPAGVRVSQPATALPAPVALAATFSRELARQYGQVLGRDTRARGQDVLLAPMVNIVRVPQAGRNFETLGEDPLLAARLVAAEIGAIEQEGVIATVKHFAANNQETQRNSVSADVDERTLHEMELVAFEAAIKAGAGSVMAAYNKVNGTWSSENATLETDILRKEWGFAGFVMSDWGATHSGVPALLAGLDMEMPDGANYGNLPAAIAAGELSETLVARAVRRILVQMDRVGLLGASPKPRPTLDVEADAAVAREIATAGAVLLKNDGSVLPLTASDFRSLAVVGPTAKVILVGGGGSARVQPLRTGVPLDALAKRSGPAATIAYAAGYDLDGVLVPASALMLQQILTVAGESPGSSTPGHVAIDATGSHAIQAGATATWTGTIGVPAPGDYELKLQTIGGRGSLAIDPQPAAGGAGRGGRGRGGGRGGSLLTTRDGFSSSTAAVHFDAGETHQVAVTAAAGAAAPMQVRLAWIPPGWRDQKIAEAVAAARAARTVVVFAYDESAEGRDRSSLSLPGYQDDLILAIATANPRTVVVLNNGAPVTMPWADKVAAILQMWYPGQEGADATAALLTGEASPSGKLPVTFPRRADDAPTAPTDRYPGVNGHGAYSEGIFVGYRWYDAERVAPLFPFGHGLSYTQFTYSDLAATQAGDGWDISFSVRNTGTRAGAEVAQVYLGAPAASPVPMALRQLVGFERVTLAPGQSERLTVHIGVREAAYWSESAHGWTIAPGRRTVFIGSSSRDLRLEVTPGIEFRK